MGKEKTDVNNVVEKIFAYTGDRRTYVLHAAAEKYAHMDVGEVDAKFAMDHRSVCTIDAISTIRL